LPLIKRAQRPLCPILVFNNEFEVVCPKFEEVANRYMPNRVVLATESAGKMTMDGGIAYITSKY
jgi:hypothetical protein